MIDRLVLWDIDGTLVRAGDLGAEVFDDAVEDVLGRRPPQRVRMSGKTDPQIVGEYLALLGEPDVPDTVGAVCLALAGRLAARADELAATGRACAGADAVLARLADDDRTVSTLLTGNIEPNAVVKVAAFGLDRWLDLTVGAYGSDDRDRTRLVPVAVGRVAARHGTEIDPDRVWVVGDTPRDLACAEAAGVHCLLVGTGRTPAADLAGLGADLVLEDLTDTERVLAAIAPR